jgi:hypothetical protein
MNKPQKQRVAVQFARPQSTDLYILLLLLHKTAVMVLISSQWFCCFTTTTRTW